MRSSPHGLLPDGAELLAIAAIWKTQRRELTASFGGASMEPSIRSGQPLRLLCGAGFDVGDVIAFVIEDQLGVHRVVAKYDGWILTRGDAKTLPDPPLCDLSRVVARIAEVPPHRETMRGWLAKQLLLTNCKGRAEVVERRRQLLQRVAALLS